MVTFEQVMNVVMPVLVVFFFGWLLIRPFSGPLGEFFRWIADKIRGKQPDEFTQTIRYE